MTTLIFRPTLLAAALAFSLLFTGSPATAQKKASPETAEQIAKTSDLRSNFLKKSRDALAEGKQHFALTLLSVRLKALTDGQDEKAKDLGGMKRNAASTIGEVTPPHLVFAKETKETMLPEAKTYIQSFKKPDERGRATDLVAQWITALDAIGNPNGDTEASKFETLANRMSLEM